MKSYLGVFVILFIVLIGQSNLISQSKQIDLELITASKAGNINKISELIEAGANVNAANKYGFTALMIESSNGHIEIVKELIKKGADVNAINEMGGTALMGASMHGYIEIVKELIKAGADVNATDEDGVTALIDASSNGYIEVVKELIKKGADINAKDEDKFTALMRANISGYTEVVNLLKAIDAVEENQVEFINQGDEIKNILINRWINLYKEDRSKLLTDRLKMAELYVGKSEKDKIRELLSKLDIKRPEKFSDIIVKTVR